MKVNKYDAFVKAKKVIESCDCYQQAIIARKYIILFNELYKDKYLYDELNLILTYRKSYLPIKILNYGYN